MLWNLSLISIIMRIREKKIGTLSTEIGPAATKIVKFWPKKHISVWVLKTLQMSCASELKPYINNNKDRWKKIRVPKYQKPLTSYHTIIYHMRILFWGFLVLWHPNFFSPILIIIDIRLKFQSTAHLECFKYPYWDLLFLAKIWLFWLQQGQFQYLKCQFFFHGSSLLWK